MPGPARGILGGLKWIERKENTRGAWFSIVSGIIYSVMSFVFFIFVSCLFDKL